MIYFLQFLGTNHILLGFCILNLLFPFCLIYIYFFFFSCNQDFFLTVGTMPEISLWFSFLSIFTHFLGDSSLWKQIFLFSIAHLLLTPLFWVISTKKNHKLLLELLLTPFLISYIIYDLLEHPIAQPWKYFQNLTSYCLSGLRYHLLLEELPPTSLFLSLPP